MRGGRRQGRATSSHLRSATVVTARLLSHKSGPVGLLVVVERVNVRMPGKVYNLALTLDAGEKRYGGSEKPVRI
jgi:hypothetical protein